MVTTPPKHPDPAGEAALTAIFDDRWVGRHGIGRFAAEVIKRCPSDITVKAVPERRERLHPLDPWRVAASLRARSAVVRDVSRDRRPHVYVTPGFNPPRGCGMPMVFAVHDLIHVQQAGWGGRLRRIYYHRVVKPAARRAFRVLTVSEYSRSSLVKYLGLSRDHLVVVGNGVGEPFTHEGWRAERRRPYVVCIANERPHKNIAMLLSAWRCSTAKDAADLVLVGCEGLRGGQGRLARRLRQDPPPAVEWVDRIHDHALAELLRGAVAAVVPSLDEGFGLPAIEAMACGTPLIAARAGALPEVVGLSNAVFVDPRSRASIVGGLERMLADERLRGVLRERGIERAASYRWDDVAERVWRVVRDAAGVDIHQPPHVGQGLP